MQNPKPNVDALSRGVRAILARHDPLGLRALGAPADEYSPEADDIVARSAQADEDAQFYLDTVWAVFVKWFGDSAGPKEAYRDLAAELYQFMSNSKEAD